jgi:Cd2+/Zn2+-exporting ATPase
MYIGEHIEAMAVVLFYTVGEYFQSRAVSKSKDEIKSLIDLKVETALCYQGGILMPIDPKEIKVGDRILVKPGERIPVDCKIVSGESMLDMSSLTGESIPVEVKLNSSILSGSINLQSPIEAIAEKEYTNSMIAKVVKMVEESTMNKAKTEEFITKFAKWYTPAVTILALLIFAIPTYFDPANSNEYLRRAAVMLVISCPCALVLSIPLTYFAGIGRSASMGVLFKGSNHLAAMSDVSDVFLDKTGTITLGNFAVTHYTNESTLSLAASIESFSNHPIAKAITTYNTFDVYQVEGVEELSGYGLKGKLDNKDLLVGNARLMKENQINFMISNESGTIVYVAYDNKFIGSIEISDEIKETSLSAINELTDSGIKVTMLTGDNDKIASVVASQVGKIDYKANLLPQNKGDFIEGTDVKQNSVFVGDGINDSVALVKSDIGVTMGQKGSDLALEVSDVVILNDDLSLLPKTIKLAKFTKKIVFQNITGSLLIKVLFLSLGAFGLSAMWMAIIADVGVSLVAVLNSIRILSKEV